MFTTLGEIDNKKISGSNNTAWKKVKKENVKSCEKMEKDKQKDATLKIKVFAPISSFIYEIVVVAF